MPEISAYNKSNDSFFQRTKLRFASLRAQKSEFNLSAFIARFKKSPVKNTTPEPSVVYTVNKVSEPAQTAAPAAPNVHDTTINGTPNPKKWCNVL